MSFLVTPRIEGFLDVIFAFIMLVVLAGGIVTMIDGGWGDGSD